MTWNYRVVKHSYNEEGRADAPEETFQIHEVYYKHDQPHMITETGMVPFGENEDELKVCMIYMMQALTKPVLDAKIFEKDPDPEKTIDQTLGMLKNNTNK